jgi:hypothetical protein
MALRYTQHSFGVGATASLTAYSPTATNLGSLMRVVSGSSTSSTYAGPMPLALARPMETGTAIGATFPYVVTYNDQYDWIFLTDYGASTIHRFVLYRFDRYAGQFEWRGIVNTTYPLSGNQTVVGMRASVIWYTSGSVSAQNSVLSSTAYGTGTAWVDDGMCVGNRIGFGSIDKESITAWYEISQIKSNTELVVVGDVGTVNVGTPYVLEEIRFVKATTNAVIRNGGIYVTKGLSYDSFSSSGVWVNAGASADNLRATYFLTDSSGTAGITATNSYSVGCSLDSVIDYQTQFLYIPDYQNVTQYKIFKYNIRAPLTGLKTSGLGYGISTAAISLSTGLQSYVGTRILYNNSTLATLQHAPVNGEKSLYVATTTRIIRIPVTSICAGATNFMTDVMVDVPPGGSNTMPAMGFNSVDDSGLMDRLVICSNSTAGQRNYISKYYTGSEPIDHVFGLDTKAYFQSLADPDMPVHVSNSTVPWTIAMNKGLAYLSAYTATLAVSKVIVVPFAADWTFAETLGQRIISPKMSTPNALSYLRCHVAAPQYVGNEKYGVVTEPYRTYFRTTGIDDNSGSWILTTQDGSLSAASGASYIQFMFEFKVIGSTCVPARIHSVGVSYYDNTTDDHYQPSVAHSSVTAKAFAWRFSTAFGTTVPTLYIRIYDAVSNNLLVEDDTATPAGTWEKSTDDGSNWTAYNTTDKGNETTYIRYTPASLGDNITVRAILSQV